MAVVGTAACPATPGGRAAGVSLCGIPWLDVGCPDLSKSIWRSHFANMADPGMIAPPYQHKGLFQVKPKCASDLSFWLRGKLVAPVAAHELRKLWCTQNHTRAQAWPSMQGAEWPGAGLPALLLPGLGYTFRGSNLHPNPRAPSMRPWSTLPARPCWGARCWCRTLPPCPATCAAASRRARRYLGKATCHASCPPIDSGW